MNVVQSIRAAIIRKCGCSDFIESPFISSSIPFSSIWSCPIFPNFRLYRTKGIARTEKCEDYSGTSSANVGKESRISKVVLKQAQKALLEYFYATRNLQFMDAENMSKNAPRFLEKLVKNIDTEGDIGWSVTRFLRYHPINEFEPFFESSGLTPIEYGPLLPRDLMFLSDDDVLLKNHHVLCDYGIARSKIGKIYKEATEIFRYSHGVLKSKLKAYEDMGYSQSLMCKAIACSPNLLIGDVSMKFVKVLEKLKDFGMEISWIEKKLSEQSSYNWSTTLEVLSLLSENGFGYHELGGLLKNHPGLIFDRSGGMTLRLVGLRVKFGSSIDEVWSMFQSSPRIQVEKFVYNLRNSIMFLLEIEMDVDEIVKIIRSHPLLLGTCKLKKPRTIFSRLNVGKKRLCSFIMENPRKLSKLVLGSKHGRLPNSGVEAKSKMMRTKFIMELGYAENSDSMNKAQRFFQGEGSKLQERFDCLVKRTGLDRKEVCEIIKRSPQILNQSKDIIETKIDVLVNELGYPISTLVTFPKYLTFSCHRIKVRVWMYNWLKEEGKVKPTLAMTSFMKCPDNVFVSRYVNRHPKGPEVWENMKRKSYVE